MEAYFEAKRRLFVEPDPEGSRPPAAVNVGDPYGRRLAEELRALGAPLAHVRPRDDADDPARRARADARPGLLPRRRHRGQHAAARPLQRRERRSPRSRRDGCSGSRTTRSCAGVEHVAGVPGRFEAVDEGQPFAVLVDYAHTPDALENVLAAARELAAGRLDLRLRLRRRPRPRQAPADGRGGRASSPTIVIVTSDNPRSEDPARDHRGDPRRLGRRAPAEVEPDRAAWRSAGPSRSRRGRRRRDRRQGPRAGPDVRRPDAPVLRPRGGADALRRLAAGQPA